MTDAINDPWKAQRWTDFRRRADYAPHKVYRHRRQGWEYIPIHPFGDESELLASLGLRPEDCFIVDAWWGIDGDATLLETSVVRMAGGPARLFAKPTGDPRWRVGLVAILDPPFVTRVAFEEAMGEFARAGFPWDKRFQLRSGEPPLDIAAV